MPLRGEIIFERLTSGTKSDQWVAGAIAALTVDLLCKYPLHANDDEFTELIRESLKQQGFEKTLKHLDHLYQKVHAGRKTPPGVLEVSGGIVKIGDYGAVDAAIRTEDGNLLLLESGPHGKYSEDPQTISSHDALADQFEPLSVDQLLFSLARPVIEISPRLICEAEFAQFDINGREALLPVLWKYINENSNSQNRDVLTAVGSAIRKFVAIMPMNRMGELSILLAPANHDPLPLDLELEVVKMIYRNFEVNPPAEPNPLPELAEQLFQMALAYANPRILLREKHSAVASLAIEAVVAMRSARAFESCRIAAESKYRWFGEMVSDDLQALERKWSGLDTNATIWLQSLQKRAARSGELENAKRA